MSEEQELPTEEEVLEAVRTLYSETPVESAGLARAANKLYAFARGHWDVNADPAANDPALQATTTATEPTPDPNGEPSGEQSPPEGQEPEAT
jgi:hypothetical protein